MTRVYVVRWSATHSDKYYSIPGCTGKRKLGGSYRKFSCNLPPSFKCEAPSMYQGAITKTPSSYSREAGPDEEVMIEQVMEAEGDGENA